MSVLVVGVLLGVALPAGLDFRELSARTTCWASQKIINQAAQRYLLDDDSVDPLALDAVKPLVEAGYLESLPYCPETGLPYGMEDGRVLPCEDASGTVHGSYR